MNKFDKAVEEKLGHYVYYLKDPRPSGKGVFYIGKGGGKDKKKAAGNSRMFQHVLSASETKKQTKKLKLKTKTTTKTKTNTNTKTKSKTKTTTETNSFRGEAADIFFKCTLNCVPIPKLPLSFEQIESNQIRSHQPR